MEVHSQVHLTGVAGTAFFFFFISFFLAWFAGVNGQTAATRTRAEQREVPSLPRDGNIDPVVRNIGRDCPT